MAERLSDAVAKIRDVQQLEAVVTAIRGIAASRAQNGRALLAGIEAYTAVVSRSIGVALNLLPENVGTYAHETRRRGLILFTAEQGFAGAFSERIFDAAGTDANDSTCLIVGTRGTAIAVERGIRPDWSTAMITRADGVPALANRLAEVIYSYVANSTVAAIDIIFSRSVASGSIEIDRRSLLPIDFGRFALPIQQQPPLTTLVPQLLLERLAAEYVYAQLCEAAVFAFIAENEARMVAMMGAKNNTETKLAELIQCERRLRQEEVTTEVVELAAGSEASRA